MALEGLFLHGRTWSIVFIVGCVVVAAVAIAVAMGARPPKFRRPHLWRLSVQLWQGYVTDRRQWNAHFRSLDQQLNLLTEDVGKQRVTDIELAGQLDYFWRRFGVFRSLVPPTLSKRGQPKGYANSLIEGLETKLEELEPRANRSVQPATESPLDPHEANVFAEIERSFGATFDGPDN